jgi:hypothetical protein
MISSIIVVFVYIFVLFIRDYSNVSCDFIINLRKLKKFLFFVQSFLETSFCDIISIFILCYC